jgi:hypothetical protein
MYISIIGVDYNITLNIKQQGGPIMAKNKSLGLILVFLLCLTVIIGCPKNELENDPVKSVNVELETEMEIQLKDDLSNYFDYPVENIKFNDFPNSSWYYFGNYNGCVVIAFEGDMAVVTTISILGLDMGIEDWNYVFGYYTTMLVWKQDNNKNGKFYTPQEAYDLKFLTQKDLGNIYEQYLINYVNKNK